MTVRIGLHRGTSPVGRLIRWQTRSSYSHASLIVGSGTKASQLWLVEAREFRGVVEDRTLADVAERVDLFDVHASPLQSALALGFMRSQIGKPYDYTMVLRFLSREHETTRSRERWFCTEILHAGYRDAGVLLLPRTHAFEVSPGLLARSSKLRYAGTYWRGAWVDDHALAPAHFLRAR